MNFVGWARAKALRGCDVYKVGNPKLRELGSKIRGMD
jgi:hypothetical protein